MRTYRFLAGQYKFRVQPDARRRGIAVDHHHAKSDPSENGDDELVCERVPAKGQRAAGELVLKQLSCYWYEMCSVINIGGCEVSDLIVNVLFKVAQAVDPRPFSGKAGTMTRFATAIALITSASRRSTTSSSRRPSRASWTLRFYAHSLVVAPEDALRAFTRVVHFVDRTDDDLDLAAALRRSPC